MIDDCGPRAVEYQRVSGPMRRSKHNINLSEAEPEAEGDDSSSGSEIHPESDGSVSYDDPLSVESDSGSLSSSSSSSSSSPPPSTSAWSDADSSSSSGPESFVEGTESHAPIIQTTDPDAGTEMRYRAEIRGTSASDSSTVRRRRRRDTPAASGNGFEGADPVEPARDAPSDSTLHPHVSDSLHGTATESRNGSFGYQLAETGPSNDTHQNGTESVSAADPSSSAAVNESAGDDSDQNRTIIAQNGPDHPSGSSEDGAGSSRVPGAGAASNGGGEAAYAMLYNEITQDVDSLQNSLKRTQEGVAQFFDRAKLLRERINDRNKKKSQSRRKPSGSDNESKLNVVDMPTFNSQILNGNRWASVFHTGEFSSDVIIEHLESDNDSLRFGLHESQSAMELVIHKARKEIQRIRDHAQLEIDRVRAELTVESVARESLQKENTELRTSLQQMANTVRQYAEVAQREEERKEELVIRLLHENQVLRSLLELDGDERGFLSLDPSESPAAAE